MTNNLVNDERQINSLLNTLTLVLESLNTVNNALENTLISYTGSRETTLTDIQSVCASFDELNQMVKQEHKKLMNEK